jgi:GT2 family glycosyltransferase
VVPEVSIAIVNWNAVDELLGCLDSLQANPPSVPFEVIVVDNASSDGSVERVRAAHSWVDVIANDSNRGLAAGNNQALLRARGAYIVVSNPDVVYHTGSIDALLDVLYRRRRAAFVFARLVNPDGSHQTAAGSLPKLHEALLGRQVLRWINGAEDSGLWWDGWAHDRERLVGHGLEACYAVRRDALVEIGPQDERFWLDWEGIDWCARAAAAGWEAWFCPQAEVVHLGGASIRKAELRWVVASHRGMYRYFAMRSSRLARPALAGAFGARAMIKAIAVMAGGRMYDRAHPGGSPTADR